MKKENILLVLWIIFGFVFVSGVDSILYFSTYLLYFGTSELGISYGILQYLMPIATLILYVLTTLLIYRKITINSNSTGIYLTTFPKKLFIGLALITLILNPITNKLSALYAKHIATMESIDTYDFLKVYGWMTIGFGYTKWLILLMLAILFLRKLNIFENQT